MVISKTKFLGFITYRVSERLTDSMKLTETQRLIEILTYQFHGQGLHKDIESCFVKLNALRNNSNFRRVAKTKKSP